MSSRLVVLVVNNEFICVPQGRPAPTFGLKLLHARLKKDLLPLPMAVANFSLVSIDWQRRVPFTIVSISPC